MKQNFFYPLLYTVIGGIVVALINFALLSPKPQRDNISVIHNVVEMDQDSAVAIIGSWLKLTPLTKDQLSQFLGELPLHMSGNDITFDTYVVENKDTKVFKDLSIYVDEADLIIVRDEAGARIIRAKALTRYPELLPSKSLNISVVRSTYGNLSWYDDHVNATFVLNGQKIPVTNLRVNPDSPTVGLANLLNNYGLWVFLFVFLSGGLWIIIAIAAVIGIATMNNIPYKARNTTDADLAKSVQILDYLQKSDPKRLEKVKELAEANRLKAAAEDGKISP